MDATQTGNLLLIVLLSPLVSAAFIWLFGRRLHAVSAGVSTLSAAIGAGICLYLLYGGAWTGETVAGLSVEWLTLGSFSLSLGFFLNDVSALMLFIVTGVGFLIHVFSLGYMKGDPAMARFFGGLSIFMFSMLGIVLADNLFMIFVFWELVGFSSYMLIGHYFTKDDAKAAAPKAFIVNRIGDFGFLLGIILTFWTFGTTDLNALAAADPAATTTVIGLLLFCGVLGKSAQMPLHVWLPDAMAGPTPISALIHAATMVAAGVFLLARIPTLFTPEALQIVAWVGVVTAVSAAIWAFAQRDIKKILAYSTLSQLGYMVAAFGLGTLYGMAQTDAADHGEAAKAVSSLFYGLGAAMFHLTTHAFFKAMLFLGSGSVIHACHHEQDIFKMGGLLKRMPITTLTFGIGVIAIAGVPFISAGFFSKDAILYVAMQTNTAAFVLLTITAVMTSAYMGRLFVIAFLGQPKSENAEHAHESPATMWVPLVILAVFSVGGGYMVLYPATLHSILYDTVPHPHGADHTLLIIISAVAALVGLGGAWLFYGAGATEDNLERRFRPAFLVSQSRFYFDEVYGKLATWTRTVVAEVLTFLDLFLVEVIGMRAVFAGIPAALGLLARSLHTGNLGGYVWWFFFGVLLVWSFATDLFGRWF